MKTLLLIGAGRFGRHIARKMSELGHEIMVVDRDEKHIQDVMPYVTNAVIGDSTDEKFLQSLGVSNYDVCICAIGNNFQASLETTSLLKELGGKLVIARSSRDVHEKFLLRNGADEVVYPEKQMGEWTAIRYSSDKIKGYTNLDGEFALYEMRVPAEWYGKTVLDVDVRKKYNINILAIKKDRKIQEIAMPNTVFDKDEIVLVLGRNEDIVKCFKL